MDDCILRGKTKRVRADQLADSSSAHVHLLVPGTYLSHLTHSINQVSIHIAQISSPVLLTILIHSVRYFLLPESIPLHAAG